MNSYPSSPFQLRRYKLTQNWHNNLKNSPQVHQFKLISWFLGFLVTSFSSIKRGRKEERKTCKPSFELRNINGSTPCDYSNLVEPKANLDLTSQVPISVGMCCCRTSGSHGEWVPCRVALLHCHDSHDCPTLRIHTHNNNSFTQIFRSS
jgi:hypothetical protein